MLLSIMLLTAQPVQVDLLGPSGCNVPDRCYTVSETIKNSEDLEPTLGKLNDHLWGCGQGSAL